MTSKAIAIAFAAFSALAGAALAQPADGGGRFGGMRQACQADIAKLCADQQPGHGQIRQCLATHSDQVSDACKSALAEVRQRRHDRQQGDPDGAPQGPTPPN